VVETRGLADRAAVRLDALLWPRPLVVEDQPRDLHLSVRPERDGRVTFEAWTGAADPGPHAPGRAIHCRGRGAVVPGGIEAASPLDIDAVRCQCANPVGVAAFYDRFHSVGIDYGPAYRAITWVAVGPDAVLARLELPEPARAGAGTFGIHPSLLDGALQAATALPDRAASTDALVPFSIQEATFTAPTRAAAWAVVRRGAASRTLDVDVCDDLGIVAVRLRGYVTRVLNRAQPRGYPARHPRGRTA
jgi:hypothetical protein